MLACRDDDYRNHYTQRGYKPQDAGPKLFLMVASLCTEGAPPSYARQFRGHDTQLRGDWSLLDRIKRCTTSSA